MFNFFPYFSVSFFLAFVTSLLFRIRVTFSPVGGIFVIVFIVASIFALFRSTVFVWKFSSNRPWLDFDSAPQRWQITSRRRDRQRQRQATARHRRRRGSPLVAQLSSRNGHRHRSRRSSALALRHSGTLPDDAVDVAAHAAVAFRYGSAATAAVPLRTVRWRRSAAAPADQHPPVRRLQHLHGVVRLARQLELHVSIGRQRRLRRRFGLRAPPFHGLGVSAASGHEEEADHGEPAWERCVHVGRADVADGHHWHRSRGRPAASIALAVDGHLRSDLLEGIAQEELGLQHSRWSRLAQRLHGHLCQNVSYRSFLFSYCFVLL